MYLLKVEDCDLAVLHHGCFLQALWFPLSTNKTDPHDITEIFLKLTNNFILVHVLLYNINYQVKDYM